MLFAWIFIHVADDMLFLFVWAKTAIAEKDAKTGHKSTSDMADKHRRIPVKASRRPGSAPFPHPGVPTTETRVSKGFKSCF